MILGSPNCFNLDSSILFVVNCAAILCLISGMFWYINVSCLVDCVVMMTYLAGLGCTVSTVPYRISDVSGVTYSSQGGNTESEYGRVCAAVRSRSWKVLLLEE